MKSAVNQGIRAMASAMFLAVLLLSPSAGLAQEARGTIGGTVRDASKAVVPGATVKVTDTARGTTVSTITNEAGLYQAPYLLPGTYQVTVEVAGFKKYIRDGIILQVNDRLAIDVELEVGTVDQSITITSDSPALDTASASLGKVVDARRIAELPIGHGDPYALIGLSTGVSFTKSQRLDRPFEPTHIVGYSIDGTRSNRSDLTIDGVASTSTANAGEVISSFVPPQDLVQEFKVQTATFDAQFGNTEGGVTNLSIKSGTNNLHGTLYYNNFMPATSANDFFANRARQPLADFFYHRYGGTAGGPVWIPKVYNGKNRTFFMYGIEGIYEARPRNNGTFSIPTQKMRSGDFSDLLALGATYQIYNPFSARADGARIRRDPFYCDASGNPMPVNANRTQAVGTPCNKLPAALINPIARNFVDNYLPLPTSPQTAADGAGNFQQPGLLETSKYQSHTIRVDHVISEKHRIYARTSWYDRNSDYNNYYNNIVTGEYFSFVSRQGVFDDVYSFSPTLVLNLRYGYNRFIRVVNSNPGNRGFDLTSLGFPSSYANLIPENIRRFPRFDISGYQGTGIGGEYRPTDTHNFVGVVNKSQGAHALKAGVEFRSYRETDSFFGNNQTGQFNFDNTYVRAVDNVAPPTQLGFSFAAFLLGVPTSGTISQPADYAEQSTTTGIFVHDDWKVNSRLTLNLGLRYEVEGALTERYNRSVSGFDPFFVQPFSAAARAAFANSQSNPNTATPEVTQLNALGGLLFAGVGGEPRALYKTPRNNYMPRIGFAFQLNDKTVLRGGYGIFFGFLGQRRGDVIQSGFSTNTPLNTTLNNGLTFVETLSNPFQSGLQTARGAADGGLTFVGQSITFFNPRPLSPYNQRWQLGVQRELPWGFVAEATYVGNRGTHIEINRNLNATPNQFLTTNNATRDEARVNYLSALVPNPFVNLLPSSAGAVFRSSTIARERLLRPFPQFDAVTTTTNDGYSWYHSGQFSLEKRFSKGYTFQASYTFSKFMEATEYLSPADPRPTEVISPEDRPHRLAVSGIYELPFGKNRPFFGNVNKVASLFVSGWQVSGIYTLQSGPPLNFGNIAYVGDPKDLRLPEDQQTLAQWINTQEGFVALRNGNTIIRGANGLPIYVDDNDPCRTTYNATTCPGTPLTTLRGFNKDSGLTLASNVRTFPLRFGFLRAQKVNNFDFGLIKKTAITEGKEIQFRAELLNALNHPLFFTTQINLNPNQAGFGQITSGTQENYARRVQLTFKLVF